MIAGAGWDVALLQECPPRWPTRWRGAATPPPTVCSPRATGSPRFALALATCNPDLIASNEGGSNLTLVRHGSPRPDRRAARAGLRQRRPERRMMAFTRTSAAASASRTCTPPAVPADTRAELLRAAEQASPGPAARR